MTDSELVARARSLGFAEAVLFDAALLVPQERIRALCRPEKCPNYGKTWHCPPHCGTIDEMAARLGAYRRAILLTRRHEVDLSDQEALGALSEEQTEAVDRLADLLTDSLRLSVGGCRLCNACTCPDAPCRRPLPRRGAVSAHGIDVTALCKALGVPFAFEKGRVVYVSIVLWND